MLLAKAADRQIEDLLAVGVIGLERAVLMARLRRAGGSEAEVEASLGFDLSGVERLVATRRADGFFR